VARMIPCLIDTRTVSRGEREVYTRLRDEPQGSHWIVIHSLNISHHVRQVEGEADFIVIAPSLGLLCLEIKAHPEVSRRNGVWRYGIGGEPDPRGPFKQAAEAMHSARKALMKRLPALSSVLWWSAVVFPYAKFDTRSDEWHPWQVIDSKAFRSGPLISRLTRVLELAQEHVANSPTARWFNPGAAEPTHEQCEAIAQALRPDFEFYETARSRVGRREAELKRFTEDQYVALDAMAANPRVVFAGPAGTGKTLLAVEAARRATLVGKRTLLLCFNRLLSKWLRDETRQLGPGLEVGTLHSYMLRLAGITPPEVAGQEYWESSLPDHALNALLLRPEVAGFDQLIVDEAQDILRASYLDTLDLSVSGGLSAGVCWFFGDFERQALYEAADMTLTEFLARRGGGWPVYKLRTNCRNVPRISALVSMLGGLQPDYSRVLRDDNGIEPSIRFYRDRRDQVGLLIQELEGLQRQGFGGSEIVVLSPRSSEACIQELPPGRWKARIRPCEAARFGDVAACTIHSFKGLEAPAIILTDVDTIKGADSEALFYTAITRAQDRLIVLVQEQVREQVIETLTRPHRFQSSVQHA
jgi:Nuclease-related domain/UvrD-like helicase C-terminal domain/PhoH-like protein